jgi:hypothetical protein
MSGTMMLGLGCLLLFAPDLLGDPWAAILVVIGALLVTIVITFIQRHSSGRVATR